MNYSSGCELDYVSDKVDPSPALAGRGTKINAQVPVDTRVFQPGLVHRAPRADDEEAFGLKAGAA